MEAMICLVENVPSPASATCNLAWSYLRRERRCTRRAYIVPTAKKNKLFCVRVLLFRLYSYSGGNCRRQWQGCGSAPRRMMIIIVVFRNAVQNAQCAANTLFFNDFHKHCRVSATFLQCFMNRSKYTLCKHRGSLWAGLGLRVQERNAHGLWMA